MPYPSRGTWRFRNVTAGFDFAPILDSIAIEELHPDGLSTFSARVRWESGKTFTNEDRIWVKFEGDKIWAGHVKVRSRTFLDEKGQTQKLWDIRGQDYTSKLEDSVITTRGERARESAADRVAFILTHLNFSITTDGVDLPAEDVEPAELENLTVREALQMVADELVLHFYIDFGPDDGGAPDLHMFRTETFDAPFDLVDEGADHSTTFPYSEFELPDDSQDLKTAVRVRGDRIRRWVKDDTQIATYGRQETPVTDTTLRTLAQVKAAGNRVLDQNDRPEVHGSLLCHEPGLRAGMRFGLVNTPWSIDTNYIAEQVSLSAVDPEDTEDKALLFSRVSFTDKRRVGRMPGGGRSRGGGGSGGSGGGGGIGDGRSRPGGGDHTGTGGGHGKCGCPVDLNEYLLDDFLRDAGEDLGAILTSAVNGGSWWEGGNDWMAQTPDIGTWSTDDVNGYVQTAGLVNHLLYDDNIEATENVGPLLPFELPTWSLRVRFRVNDAIEAVDNQWTIGWNQDEVAANFGVSFGTGSFLGATAVSAATDTALKPLVANTWYWVRMEVTETEQRIRLWADGDEEPTSWDASAALSANTDPDNWLWGISFGFGHAAGSLQVTPMYAGGGAVAGELVEGKSIAHGSGGIIDVGEAYEPGTLTVRVDDDVVAPDSFDPPAGTADLGEEVYHDPSDHPGGCAKVVVSYRKA